MKLLLNDLELEIPMPQEMTLGKALATVQEHHVADEDAISTILVDGEHLTAERLSLWQNRPVSEFAEARIEAPSRNQLASQGLRMIAQGLTESEGPREEIVEGIRQGRPGEAMTKLTPYLDMWSTTGQSTGSVCRLLGIDFDDVEGVDNADLDDSGGSDRLEDARQLAEGVSRLAGQLQELKSAIEAGDFVLAGDILDYEFSELTENWREMLGRLAEQFENSG